MFRKAAQNRILHIHYTLLMKAGLRQNRENQLIFGKLNLYAYGDSETASFPIKKTDGRGVKYFYNKDESFLTRVLIFDVVYLLLVRPGGFAAI